MKRNIVFTRERLIGYKNAKFNGYYDLYVSRSFPRPGGLDLRWEECYGKIY